MILRRIAEHLKAQNWTAVGLDLAIVIVGVFIGTQVSNWNQSRIEKRETARLLGELQPALQGFADYFDTAGPYYATTRDWSDTAFAGWRGDPAVSDEQFVIAAYQASQIYTFGVDGDIWASIFGGDRLREIDDVDVRRGLAVLMSFNYEGVDLPAIATPYRQQVRSVIPEDIQDAIRAECGDQQIGKRLLELRLPKSCDLDLPASRFTEGAASLRAHPELVNELRWHRAAIASFLDNLAVLDRETRALQTAIAHSDG
jgi:hypothetical protein